MGTRSQRPGERRAVIGRRAWGGACRAGAGLLPRPDDRRAAAHRPGAGLLRRPGAALAAFLLAVALTVGLGAGAAAPAGAHVVEKGLWDDTFVGADPAAQDAILAEIANDLGAKTVRLMAYWAELEPQEGLYDTAKLSRLSQAVGAARAHGLKVIITFYQVPQWASDRTFWSDPPGASFDADTYYPFYLPRLDVIGRWQAFVTRVATLLKGQVFAYEAWNEPNLRWFWYPQQWQGDQYFGVDRYSMMLGRVRAAVDLADPAALVLAGNTASMGYDDRSSTSPQRWARRLDELGVAAVMDAYSHHPYALGNTKPIDPPEKIPRFPRYTVTLGNIKTLLDIFPNTDFYLTEYGYNSKASRLFAGGGVGETAQASYLRRAFWQANKHPQIKMLMWYLRQDISGSPDVFDPEMYTGLRRTNDTLKPAWYAFAGQNAISVRAARRVKRGGRAALAGYLTHGGQGLVGKTLIVQRRTANGWMRIATCRTAANGRYRVSLRLRRATVLRVVWRGVATSPQRVVRVF